MHVFSIYTWVKFTALRARLLTLVAYANAFREQQWNIIPSWLLTKCPKSLPKDIRSVKSCLLASPPTSSPTTFPCGSLCFRFRYARDALISESHSSLPGILFSHIILELTPLLHSSLCSNVRGLSWLFDLKMACALPHHPRPALVVLYCSIFLLFKTPLLDTTLIII